MIRMVVWLLVVLLLFGCEAPEPPKREDPIRIGTNVWPGYEPLYLARELDDWPADQLRLVEYPSASEVLRAFRNQSLEAASLTLDEVLLLRSQGIPVTVILIHDISDGGDVIIARQGIRDMAQLKGRRVGVEAGALGALMLTRALELNNLSLDDIVVVNSDVNRHERAFISHEVDAVVTFEPVRSRLLDQGGHEIFSSKQIPGEIVDVLAVHRSVFESRPQAMKYLTSSWFRAIAYMQQNMPDAADLMAARLHISPQAVIESYQGLVLPDLALNKAMLGGEQPTLQKTVAQLNRVMVTHRLLQDAVVVEDLYTDEYLP